MVVEYKNFLEYEQLFLKAFHDKDFETAKNLLLYSKNFEKQLDFCVDYLKALQGKEDKGILDENDEKMLKEIKSAMPTLEAKNRFYGRWSKELISKGIGFFCNSACRIEDERERFFPILKIMEETNEPHFVQEFKNNIWCFDSFTAGNEKLRSELANFCSKFESLNQIDFVEKAFYPVSQANYYAPLYNPVAGGIISQPLEVGYGGYGTTPLYPASMSALKIGSAQSDDEISPAPDPEPALSEDSSHPLLERDSDIVPPKF